MVLPRNTSLRVLGLAAAALGLSASFNAATAFSNQHNAVAVVRPSSVSIIPRSRAKALESNNNISSFYRSRRKSPVHASSSDESESVSSNKASSTFKQDIYNVATLIAAQGLLIPIALFIGQISNLPNTGLGSQFQLGYGTTLEGLRWTLPLFGVAGLLRIVEPYSEALQNVTKATQRSILSVLGSKRRPFFAFLVSCILGAVAGIGEEWLFRGVFQELLTQKFGSAVSLAISGLVFGLLHAVTPVYALLAGAASVFFGYLYIVSQNLAVPMITHAVYDVFALMWAHWSVTALHPEEMDAILSGFPGALASSTNTYKDGHLNMSDDDGEDGGPKVYNS